MIGSYQLDPSAYVFMPCSPAEACIGNNECADGYEGNIYMSSSCRHHIGYMCASCSVGYYKDGSGGYCYQCGIGPILTFYSVILLLLLLPAMVLIYSVDGNGNDGRFGLLSIIINWCQYSGMHHV